EPHRRGGFDEGVADRVAVDAEREADRQRDDGDGDGEAHAQPPPLLRDALALLERDLQRVDAPLELDLARMVSGSCKQRHSGSGPAISPAICVRGSDCAVRRQRAAWSWGLRLRAASRLYFPVNSKKETGCGAQPAIGAFPLRP